VLRERVVALKLLRPRSPDGAAADALREIRGTLNAILAELDR
jgi:hypothetical protein